MQLQYDLNIIIKRATILFSFSLSRDIDNILVSVYPPLFCSKNILIGFIDCTTAKLLFKSCKWIHSGDEFWLDVCVCARARSILVWLTWLVATAKGLQSLLHRPVSKIVANNCEACFNQMGGGLLRQHQSDVERWVSSQRHVRYVAFVGE